MVDAFSISRLTLMIAITVSLFIFGCGDNEVTVTPPQQLALQKTPSPSFTPQDNYLFNPEAEAGEGNQITYWDKETTASDKIRLYRETDGKSAKVRYGRASFAISNLSENTEVITNSWLQKITSNIPIGRTIRMGGYIKAEWADEGANFSIQCIGPKGQVLASAKTPTIFEQKDWLFLYSDPVTVPEKTVSIDVRLSLTGVGNVWFDGLVIPEFDPEIKVVVDEELTEKVEGKIVKAIPVNKDSMTLAYMLEWNHGNIDHIAIANCHGGARLLVDWPDIAPKDAANPDYSFILALYSKQTDYLPPASQIGAYEILGDWSELVSCATEPVSSENALSKYDMEDGNDWKFFDVTEMIRDQQSSAREKHGVIVHFDKEDLKAKWSCYRFVSKEASKSWLPRYPKLLIVNKEVN